MGLRQSSYEDGDFIKQPNITNMMLVTPSNTNLVAA